MANKPTDINLQTSPDILYNSQWSELVCISIIWTIHLDLIVQSLVRHKFCSQFPRFAGGQQAP